jgi:hypothetical protein
VPGAHEVEDGRDGGCLELHAAHGIRVRRQ